MAKWANFSSIGFSELVAGGAGDGLGVVLEQAVINNTITSTQIRQKERDSFNRLIFFIAAPFYQNLISELIFSNVVV